MKAENLNAFLIETRKIFEDLGLGTLTFSNPTASKGLNLPKGKDKEHIGIKIKENLRGVVVYSIDKKLKERIMETFINKLTHRSMDFRTHESSVPEFFNIITGNVATAFYQMIKRRVDISPPFYINDPSPYRLNDFIIVPFKTDKGEEMIVNLHIV